MVKAPKKLVSSKAALDYLENNELTSKEHLRLLGILNKQFNAFPLGNVVVFTQDGALAANGRKLDLDETVKFRQGIGAIKDNWAFQLLGDQVLYEAIKHGVHLGDTPEKMMFSKTAIYFITKFRELLNSF